MAGVVLATGIIEIIPSMRGSQATIVRELSKTNTTAVGEQLGKQMGGGLAGSLKKTLGPALALLGTTQIASFGKKTVGMFSELEDSTAAAGVVFGDSMSSIIQQSKTASRSLGLTEQQVINAANTYGTYGKSAGLAGADLAKFSTDFTGLAADMASFKGTSPEQAIEAIGAALRGETEPIRAYGVMLDDASMRQEALALGIVSTTKDALTPQQKILAAQSLIFKQTADAQGDFARTSDSTANIAKTLSAETQNLGAKLGQILAPAFTASRLRALGLIGGLSGLADRVIAFQALLGQSALTPELVRSLGLDPGTGLGYFIGEGIGGLRAFSAAWKANDGDITSAGFPGWMEGAAYQTRLFTDSIGGMFNVLAKGDFTNPIFGQEEDSAFAGQLFQVRDAAKALTGGDFSQVAPLFTALSAVAKPAGPLLVEVGGAIGELSGEIGGLVAGALPLAVPLLEGATAAMNYLAENTGVLKGVIIALAAGWVIYKGAQAAANIADLARIPLLVLQAGANLSLAGAIRAQTAAMSTNNAVSAISLETGKKTTRGMALHAAAATGAATGTTAFGAASGVAAIGTRALGFAVKALPFVGLAAIIASLVAGLVLFFTETETGKAIIANAWTFIQGAVAGVVSFFQTHVMPVITTVFTAVGDAAVWFYQNAILPTVSFVKGAIAGMIASFQAIYTFVKPVFDGIGVVLNGFWLLARGIFQVVVSIIKNILIPAFVGFWKGTIVPVFDGIGSFISLWWTGVKLLFGWVVDFIRGTLAAGFTWFRDRIITPVFDFIGRAIDGGVKFWTGVFQKGVDFVRNTFGPAFTWFRDSVITPVWDAVGGKISGIYNDKIKPIFDFFADKIEKVLPAAFEAGKKAIEKTWNKIEGIAKAPVKFVVETVLNNGLIKGFNVIAGILPDVDKLPNIALPAGFARGGVIPGRDPGKRDNVLTPMRSGEGVLVPEALQALGADQLHALNHAANIGGTSAARRVLDAQAIKQSPTGATPSLNTGFPGIIARTSGNHAYVEDNAPGWYVAQAAQIINGMSALKLSMGKSGTPRIQTYIGGQSFPPNVLAFASGNEVRYNPGGSGPGMGREMKRAVSIHELLHVLGQAHTNAASIMQPVLGGYMTPTPYDVANMVRLYGAGDGSMPAGDDGWSLFDNPLTGMLDGLVKKFTEAFRSDDVFAGLAIGIGKFIFDKVKSWVTGLLPDWAGGGDDGGNLLAPRATVFDGGGWLHNTGGKQMLVEHNKIKPDAVIPYQTARDMGKLAAERMALEDLGGRGGPQIIVQGDVNKATPEEIVNEFNRKLERAANLDDLRAIARGGEL